MQQAQQVNTQQEDSGQVIKPKAKMLEAKSIRKTCEVASSYMI
jgi:hypothetical protein